MLAVQFQERDAPRGQAELRKLEKPVREEWQPDGSWTGLFDVPDERIEEFEAAIDEVSTGEVKTKRLESEEDIGGHRIALYVFGAVPDNEE